MATHRIRLNNEEIPYLLLRSPRRRSIGLKVGPTGLTVSVPARLLQHEWEAVLHQKSDWVRDKLEHMRAHAVPDFCWQHGEFIPFLGRSLELVVETGGPRTQAVRCDSLLRVGLADPGDSAALKNRVIHWYRREALVFFQDRVQLLARQLDVSVSRLSLTSARTRWGSCSSSGAIRLNWRLIKAPPAVIDYVVVHELAHLIELNHSSAFWQIVTQACPDFREQKIFLKKHGAGYHQF
ncbi:MAG: SprT family zinc-dependent metalloprotease [Sulfurimicrobium sp.]|nr:SprT family zinc-dependent metalloprotease [Sulfurimicrobium sp.]